MAVTPETDARPWRLFVAIELSDSLRKALGAPADALAGLRDWIRVSPLDQIHLTLHFLGNVEVARIQSLSQGLAHAVGRHVPFELTVRGVSAFGEAHRPKVLWAGFAEPGLVRLRGLQRDTGIAVREAGFEIDDEFTPHLTLGRVRRPLRSEGRRAVQHWYADWHETEFGTLSVAAVHLMRSRLGSGPAQHSVVESFELQ